MGKIYKINLFNALVFMACGIGGFIGRYMEKGDFQPTALIPTVLGLLLLVMTPGMKSENKVITRVVILLTLVFGVFIGSMFFKEAALSPLTLKVTIFGIITVSSFVSFVLYVILSRKEKAASRN